MDKEKSNINFLNKLAGILAKKFSPNNSIMSINKLFKAQFDFEKTEFVIWDNNNMVLKDFLMDSKIFESDDKENTINSIYSSLAIANGTKFFFNEDEFYCDIKENELFRLTELNSENNTIIYPLVSNGEVFGLMKITSGKQEINQEFFALLNISSKLISGTIINQILNEQMDISLAFYKAMKDIAKIIESQYELSYIIPLIGEMIDRFMSSHLIYIFIFKDNKYQLVWPNACKDKAVYNLLDGINLKTECIISENSKIGVFPLINEENILGAIVAYSNIEKFLQKDIDYLIQLTRQSGLTIQRANVYAEVLKYATMDALTGLNNRRQFELRLNQEVSNSKRNNMPLCCMMIDVDYFKKVNDTYGHAAGDCVLKDVSEVIKNEIREYDIACRYGGEEFFIILPQTKLTEATSVAQRLRKVIEETKMDIKEAGLEGISHLKVTASIGVCEYNNVMTPSEFAQKADKALYEAKTTGRNRVIVI